MVEVPFMVMESALPVPSDGLSPRSILITGASGGIGGALALDYAEPGTTLHLTGREVARLDAVARACRARGAVVIARTLDVIDRPAMEAWVHEAEATHPLDLVIANAGVCGGAGDGPESAEQTRAIFAVNIDGVLNTVLPALPPMLARRSGHIALMSSLDGLRLRPGMPAYCASKTAVRIWGEALRRGLEDRGVRVSVICPGTVRTRMSRNGDRWERNSVSAAQAARIIRDGIAGNRARIAFPSVAYAAARLRAALPH